MQRDDLIRLRHMLDAAREAVSFVQGQTPIGLGRQSHVATLSLVKDIEIIGEAAAQIAQDARAALSQIPWPSIIAMRNRLIHAYFDIDADRVWDTVTTDLPPLIATLEHVPATQS
jgi:uncharacterized protein with HEPN domain